ncbi:ATP phosphoribosyltransferase regulatory subunit [Sagittula sp. SSi028]|uniref:ATP phosphoribosyltransferase regulatory subunit n=1 Tax=Sagittula sp. SSi028 TaxID=3400636 RepID=UPI003AF9BFC2
MKQLADARLKAEEMLSGFIAAGAVRLDCEILQPAETLLDLYGEDIRTRAYTVQDPSRGELMLRPDFTVPVVQMHMTVGADPARYAYAGMVFRRQEEDDSRASEYWQVGYEIFGEDRAEADAEAFVTLAGQLQGLPVAPVTGDIGILSAAVAGLDTTDARKAALMRHIWRPRRFRALLDRFSGKGKPSAARKALLASDAPLSDDVPMIGLRSGAEITARITALRDDAAAAPLSADQVALLDSILNVRETAPFALEQLRDISVDLPAIVPALERFSARCDALSAKGVDVDALAFEGSYGRTSMEYYDGFVFGFVPERQPDLGPVAMGGRYDALVARLGQGREIPAVGGVIRPDLICRLEDRA